MRGFTLVELAIVIVIAGILAAVAIPIYQGLVNDSKWSEAKTAAGTVRQSLDVYRAKNNNLSGLTTGNMSSTSMQTSLKLQNAFDGLRYFVASDITISVINTTASTYTLSVSSGSVTDGPSGGPYKLNDAGAETGP